MNGAMVTVPRGRASAVQPVPSGGRALTASGALCWSMSRALIPALGLIGCGPTMPAQVIAPAAAGGAGAVQGARPVDVDSSRMVASVQPTADTPCAGLTYPIDGRAAFDAAVRSSIDAPAGGAIRRVAVSGDRLVFSYGAGPVMFGQVMLAPTATITTRMRIDTAAGGTEVVFQSNGTGHRPFNGFVGCGALGDALAEAYRDSLRDMSNQIADRMWLVGWSVAGVPSSR